MRTVPSSATPRICAVVRHSCKSATCHIWPRFYGLSKLCDINTICFTYCIYSIEHNGDVAPKNYCVIYTGVLSPTRKETSYSDRIFWCSYILFIIKIGGILILFIYTTRLASKEIFSPSNKIHREVGRAKDSSAPRYILCAYTYTHTHTHTHVKGKKKLACKHSMVFTKRYSLTNDVPIQAQRGGGGIAPTHSQPVLEGGE